MIDVSVRKRQGRFEVDVAFTREDSGVTALFGPSGAGKTSVVNMIAGLTRPDAGYVRLNGTCLFDSKSGTDQPPERRRIGYVFQDGRLLPHLSVLGNLTYGMRLTPRAKRYLTLEQVVDLLGISHLLKRRPYRLSGGEKQRVAIGRALLTSPSLLLMDEPLASLDEARKSEVLPFIRKLCRELCVPILYVSHALDEICALAGHVVILDNGRVVTQGSPRRLMAEGWMQRS